ncbi:MAG: tetratricopeptide repeat protein [Alkalinema sp. RU_4_3]|nr:tetratricopeptide repeat protein [Alkalinema sp. RU_4_3]
MGVSIFPMLQATTNNVQPAASPQATQTPQARIEELKKQADGYTAVLQREPENPTALRGLLEAKLGLGDVKGAIEPLEKLAKLNPQETRYSVLLAQAKQQMGDLESAAQVYRDVLKGKPGNVEALGGLSALLMDQKRPEAAILLLKDTLKEAPKTNQAAPGSVDTLAIQVLLGKVLAADKRYDEAIGIFDGAAKENGQNFQPVFYKAQVLQQQGKNDEAKPLFEKAAGMAPVQFKDQILKAANPAPPEASPAASPAPTAAPPSAPLVPDASKPDAPKTDAPKTVDITKPLDVTKPAAPTKP